MLQKSIRLARVSAILISAFSVALGSTRHAAASAAAGVSSGAPSTPQKDQSKLFSLEQFRRGADDALTEFGAARSDHAAIALDIGQCYKEIGDPIHWSPAVRAILLFELDEHLMHTLLYDPEKAKGQQLPTLNPFHAAAVSFSDRVSRNRLEFRRDLEDNRSRSEWYQYIIIGLGTSATILVTIRSIMKEKTWISSAVGVFAIVFSAAGAAVSSMNTFEGSQASALRDQRALSQLQQLHWRIASDVLSRSELCSNPAAPPGEAMEVVDAWRTRLEAILDSAVESISRPGDIISGGGILNPAAPGKNERFEGPASGHNAGVAVR